MSILRTLDTVGKEGVLIPKTNRTPFSIAKGLSFKISCQFPFRNRRTFLHLTTSGPHQTGIFYHSGCKNAEKLCAGTLRLGPQRPGDITGILAQFVVSSLGSFLDKHRLSPIQNVESTSRKYELYMGSTNTKRDQGADTQSSWLLHCRKNSVI